MSKTCLISAPVDTYSGYGARSRDIVKGLMKKYPDWEFKILSQRWGQTSFGFLEDHGLTEILEKTITKVDYKPDIWIQITVPNEFKPLGRFNVGITAGIETTKCDSTWIEGVNRMDLVITSSEHSKKVFEESEYVEKRKVKKATTPIEVLFEGVDTSIYFETEGEKILPLSEINNKFCFLVIGHWMQGKYGHDRKNISFTIKTFLESFKTVSNPPALILKIQKSAPSIIDREEVLQNIRSLKHQIGGSLPDVYLLHGDLTDAEINALYNHPNVKAMISLTKGEGFGRPLLEFSTTGKPIICSNWSGPVDFLDPKYVTLVPGGLHNVDPSAAVDKVLLTESKWFHPTESAVKDSLKETFKNYKKVLKKSKSQKTRTLNNFTLGDMNETLFTILEDKIPDFPEEITLNLPTIN